jgi:hypothetical protein
MVYFFKMERIAGDVETVQLGSADLPLKFHPAAIS